jgi:hypothetical protein
VESASPKAPENYAHRDAHDGQRDRPDQQEIARERVAKVRVHGFVARDDCVWVCRDDRRTRTRVVDRIASRPNIGRHEGVPPFVHEVTS